MKIDLSDQTNLVRLAQELIADGCSAEIAVWAIRILQDSTRTTWATAGRGGRGGVPRLEARKVRDQQQFAD
jgi:hypothetical protein